MPTMRVSTLVAALALLSVSIFAQPIEERARSDDLAFMRDEEPAMQRAFQVARRSLDQFLNVAAARSPDHTGFALKVAISQGADTEYFWVNNFEVKGTEGFEGEINNEPRMIRTVHLGQRYMFDRSHVVDWTYIDKLQRKIVGNFTLCALLTKEAKAEAEAMKKRFKLDCSLVVE